MADYYRDTIRLLKDGGYELKRQGRGDHEIWWNPKTGIHVVVDRKLKSRLPRTEF
jgi:predicted RNA binding protein YcfA (HicA-like mRNA interferase family)